MRDSPWLALCLAAALGLLSPGRPIAAAESAAAGAEGEAAAQVETDVGHADATAGLESPTDFRGDLAVWTFVVFLLLLALLAKFAWGPIMEGLDRREQGIADKIDEAQRGAEEAARKLEQYEARLAAAGEEARQMLAEARQDAETTKDRILAEAQQAAEASRQRALQDIAAATNVALDEITERSVDLAQQIAGQLLRRELQPQDRARLIKEALEQLPNRN